MEKVRILKVKGDAKAERMIKMMLKRGWELKNQSTRKAVWGMTTGLLTKKQIHTLTFTKS